MPLRVSGPALFFPAKAEEARQRDHTRPGEAGDAMSGKRKGTGFPYRERSDALD